MAKKSPQRHKFAGGVAGAEFVSSSKHKVKGDGHLNIGQCANLDCLIAYAAFVTL